MTCDDCKTGFKWDGAPTGKEIDLNGAPTYVTGDCKDAAVLILSDFHGYKLPNVRILADHYAKEANATVYVPDLFGGESVPEEFLTNPGVAKEFNLGAFLKKNSKDNRYPEIKAHAQTLKSQYTKVAAVGFCYGAWACLRLAADPSLIDAVSIAHPSGVEHSEIDGVKVPVQVLSPEHDHEYNEALKQYTFETFSKLDVEWEYVYFPGMKHGFAVRGDPSDQKQKHGLERAKRSAVHFFNEYLH